MREVVGPLEVSTRLENHQNLIFGNLMVSFLTSLAVFNNDDPQDSLMTKRNDLNDSSTLQRRVSTQNMQIHMDQGSARRGLTTDGN